MAQDLVINGVTYNGVESLEIPNAEGKEVKYVEEDSVKLPELTNPGAAADLLEGTQLIDAEGKVVEGAMPDNQPETVVLDNSNQRYTIPAGKHDGTGVVKINACMKEFTPTKENQFYESDDGVVCTEVLVYSIPDKYQDVSGVTATAEDVAAGKVFVDAEGNVVTGTAEAGSGAESDQTCTVTFDNSSVSGSAGVYLLTAIVLENGVRKSYVYCIDANDATEVPRDFTIPNVVCGTPIHMIFGDYNVAEWGVYVDIQGSATYDSHQVIDSRFDRVFVEFTAPLVADEDCVVYYAADVE